MAGKIGEQKVRCSFCNKSEDQVRKLIAGPDGVYICDECIEICDEILEEELEDEFNMTVDEEINLLKPEEIKAFLDDYVIREDRHSPLRGRWRPQDRLRGDRRPGWSPGEFPASGRSSGLWRP